MNKLSYKIEDNAIKVGLDADLDSKESLSFKLSLNEAIQEAFDNKNEVVLVNKKIAIKFSGTKLILTVDTDQDGVALLALEVDLFEAIEETGLLKK